MNGFTTWIRVEDETGQFDHPKGLDLPKGVKKVSGYDEYVGPFARPSKPRTDKSGAAPAERKDSPKADEKPADK